MVAKIIALVIALYVVVYALCLGALAIIERKSQCIAIAFLLLASTVFAVQDPLTFPQLCTGKFLYSTGGRWTCVHMGAGSIGDAILGDLLYGTTGGDWANLAANSTGTKKYLQSLSSAVPSWQQVAFADLSGTAAYTQGGTGQVTAPDDNALIGSGTSWDLKTIPNCTDTTGNHLNYDQSSNTISCGASSSVPLPLALASGGTHADLSATGGTHFVLRQSSVGANVTVSQLACADLSDAAAGCSATALPPNGGASGDLSGSYPSPTVAKVNGNTPGNTCTNQVETAIDSSARGTCNTITPAYMDQTAAYTLSSSSNAFTGAYTVSNAAGSEIVVNGTFTGSATGWTEGSGWAYSSNAEPHSSNGTATLTPSSALVLTVGQLYKLSYTVSSWTVGTVTAAAGGQTGQAAGANGTYLFYFVALTTATLTFTPTSTARFTLDDVSLKTVIPVSTTTGPLRIVQSLTDASSNETAVRIDYTTNKTAGNDTGLIVNQIDTASPGTSNIVDFQNDGTSRFLVSGSGNSTTSGTITTGGGANGGFKLGNSAGHIQQADNTSDVAGTITVSNPATTGSYTFATAFSSAPVCVITPITTPAAVGSWWVTTSTTAVTANVTTTPAASIVFHYVCIGNPN